MQGRQSRWWTTCCRGGRGRFAEGDGTCQWDLSYRWWAHRSLSPKPLPWPGTIVGSGIWQTAGSLMYNSGYTAQQFECTQFIAQKMFIALPIGPWGFLSFSMSYLESSWPWVEFNILNNFFFELYSLGGILHLHIQEWIIEGAICYIELACVVPLSGGETVYIKVLIFISEATCEQLCVP